MSAIPFSDLPRALAAVLRGVTPDMVKAHDHTF